MHELSTITRVRISQHGADGEKDFGDSKGGRPLITENIQADASVAVDVWVIYPRGEVDLKRMNKDKQL